MKKSFFTLIMTFLALIVSADTITNTTVTNENGLIVYKFSINKEIGPDAWRITKLAIENAKAENADILYLYLNTYGGMVNYADSIRTRLLNHNKPVYVLIGNNAASAGALISISCDKIFMKKGTSIGAATVVNQNGEVMPDKYQSYMRAKLRATAEAHGYDTIYNKQDTILKWKRNPDLAEAMNMAPKTIKGIVDSAKVLTFTANEAVKHGYCDGIVNNIDDIMKLEKIASYKVSELKLTSMDRAIGFLINPIFQGILIMIIIGGIYFELQSPGVGFPLAASIVAALVYFSPLYIQGLAENWEILIFIAGLILVALEIFAIPGFGVAGISGILLIITGLSLSLIDNVDFTFTPESASKLANALMLVSFSFFTSLIISIVVSVRLFKTNAFSFMVLSKQQDQSEGWVSADISKRSLTGEYGVVYSDLRPSGKVEINNKIHDAISIIGFLDKGTKVKVVKFEGNTVYVKEEK